MKYIAFVTLLLFAFNYSDAQSRILSSEPPAEQPKTFTFVEQMPEYPGGVSSLMQFLQEHIVYPQLENDMGVEGRVLIKFVVCEDGSVADVEVTKSVSAGLDSEAVRVVKMFPKFKAGTQQGVPVRVLYYVPIVYRLSDDKNETSALEKKNNTDANFRNAVSLIKSNDYPEAIKAFTLSVEEFPNDYLSYQLKADCEILLGKKEEACKDYDKAWRKGSLNAREIIANKCK